MEILWKWLNNLFPITKRCQCTPLFSAGRRRCWTQDWDHARAKRRTGTESVRTERLLCPAPRGRSTRRAQHPGYSHLTGWSGPSHHHHHSVLPGEACTYLYSHCRMRRTGCFTELIRLLSFENVPTNKFTVTQRILNLHASFLMSETYGLNTSLRCQVFQKYCILAFLKHCR